MIKTCRPLLALLATTLLAACTSISPSSQIPAVDTSFRDMPALSLNVSTVTLTNSAPSTPAQTGGYGIKITPPAAVFESYTQRRLIANGQAGFLNIDLQQAALTAKALPASGKWTDNFTLGTPTEYTFNLRVGTALTGTGTPEVKSAYTLERKVTIPPSTTMAQREHDVNTLIVETIMDMDEGLSTALRDTMHIVIGQSVNLLSPTPSFPSLPDPHRIGAPTPLR